MNFFSFCLYILFSCFSNVLELYARALLRLVYKAFTRHEYSMRLRFKTFKAFTCLVMAMSDNESSGIPHISGDISGRNTGTNNHLQDDFNAVDAVSLFNSKLDAALEKQRISIVSELQDKLKFNSVSTELKF